MLLHHKHLMNNAFAKHNGCGAAVENISLPLFGNNILHLERKILSSWFYSKERANQREQSLLSEEYLFVSIKHWQNFGGNGLKLCLFFISVTPSASLGGCWVCRARWTVEHHALPFITKGHTFMSGGRTSCPLLFSCDFHRPSASAHTYFIR